MPSDIGDLGVARAAGGFSAQLFQTGLPFLHVEPVEFMQDAGYRG